MHTPKNWYAPKHGAARAYMDLHQSPDGRRIVSGLEPVVLDGVSAVSILRSTVNSHPTATPFRVQFRPLCESRMGLSM